MTFKEKVNEKVESDFSSSISENKTFLTYNNNIKYVPRTQTNKSDAAKISQGQKCFEAAFIFFFIKKFIKVLR